MTSASSNDFILMIVFSFANSCCKSEALCLAFLNFLLYYLFDIFPVIADTIPPVPTIVIIEGKIISGVY